MECDTVIKHSQIDETASVGSGSFIMNSSIGRKCSIDKRNYFVDARIDDMTYTGVNTNIISTDIGKYCCISRNIDIGGNEHNYLSATMYPEYRLKSSLGKGLNVHHKEKPVVIGNDVWIGAGVCIIRKPGLTIGDGAVIGAGAIITKSVPPYAIVAGVPAKVIKYRFSPEIIQNLLDLRWWDWDFETVYENRKLLTADINEEIIEKLKKISNH